jgi:hypothetical protein
MNKEARIKRKEKEEPKRKRCKDEENDKTIE